MSGILSVFSDGQKGQLLKPFNHVSELKKTLEKVNFCLLGGSLLEEPSADNETFNEVFRLCGEVKMVAGDISLFYQNAGQIIKDLSELWKKFFQRENTKEQMLKEKELKECLYKVYFCFLELQKNITNTDFFEFLRYPSPNLPKTLYRNSVGSEPKSVGS